MKNKIEISKIANFLNTKLSGDSVINRKAFSSQIAITEGEEKTFIAKITSNATDRDGELILPSGCDLSEYESNPVVQWNHTYSLPPVGKVVGIQVQADAIFAKIKMADTSFANELWELIKGGFLRTLSIGFVSVKELVRGTAAFAKYVKDNALEISNDTKKIITEYILMENSLVPIPANRDAIITAYTTKSLHISTKLAKEMGIKAEDLQEEVKVETPEVKVEVMETKIEEPKVEAVEPKAEEPKVEAKEEPKVEEVVEPKAESTPESKVEEPKVEVKEETPIVEPKVETPEPKLEEVVEPTKEPEIWYVYRNGEYIPTDSDLAIAKSLQSGKIH